MVAEAFTVGAAVVVFTAGEEAAAFMAVVAVSMVAAVASTVEVALLAGVADFIAVEDIVVAAPTGAHGLSAAPHLLAEGVTTEAEAMVADQRQAATEQAEVRTAGLVLRAA